MLEVMFLDVRSVKELFFGVVMMTFLLSRKITSSTVLGICFMRVSEFVGQAPQVIHIFPQMGASALLFTVILVI